VAVHVAACHRDGEQGQGKKQTDLAIHQGAIQCSGQPPSEPAECPRDGRLQRFCNKPAFRITQCDPCLFS
jgi:hypothetical protein